MIKGIGVDLCRISRMEKLLYNEHLLKRVFHQAEYDYAMSKANPARHLAASFAAREAFAKATGLDFFKVIFKGFWLQRTSSAPVPCFSPVIEQWVEEQNVTVHISLSHDGDYAIAFVIVEVVSGEISI
ncbi:MAG: holo-ACP synthase [Aminobacterium sp.]|jgi:holo-[acyl-carrier protein] synthase|uniref:holo-ACP synthase n=1 Tax=unclassified Aminobacterium TaxID=2685012 RepID=UPI001BCE0CDA|nr:MULTISPECIES: holo-ACP synthase [unclassified Aminobacterium]MDD2207659.1 holo-ACP synthase [Aminobacterium sp.]MDD3427239.1 holo-ACP synthase [Aminobacterium sp.]MDD3708619.1 holo-ACP synthase [Aminobacterium sp.]MDD4229339.1 holo-ACP synthase [Aminobacterium sp.]MDD4552478.1 holo-ACP synthase [Aminobacterium sp.]